MNDVIFDGKWSFRTEWKMASENRINNELSTVVLKSAHQGENIFILIDVLSDRTFDRMSDRAIVCFDSKNDKSKIPREDDFCFVASSGKLTGSTLQGGSNIPRTNYFNAVLNPEGFIGIGSMSDSNDRYSKIPHETYEFKIPLDEIGRSDNYGFYFQVYDNDKLISYWPNEFENNYSKIPSPKYWGNLISPDKSLPEFEIPFLLFLLSSTVVIFIVKIKKKILIQNI